MPRRDYVPLLQLDAHLQAYAIVYVLDAANEARMAENRTVLGDLLGQADLAGKPALVLLNKQDKEGALDEFQCSDRLEVQCSEIETMRAPMFANSQTQI